MRPTRLLILSLLLALSGCPSPKPPEPSGESQVPAPGATVAPEESPPPAATPETPAPAAPAAPAEAPGEESACNAEAAQFAIGRAYTPELAEEARRAAGAKVARPLRPGEVVTMEYRGDRLNLGLDEKGNVTRVACG